MAEDFQTRNEQKNTVATVGMVFSIIWLIALITVIFARLWLPLLFVWLILWIIGLFYKPRGKARVAVCIPLIVFIAIFSVSAYIWKSIKTPAVEFVDWLKIEFENIDEKSFDKERFNNITNEEFDNIISSMTEEDFKALIENSTWSNILEKSSYVIFGLLQQWFETSLEKYNNWEIPEISDNKIVTVDIDVEPNENENENIDENKEIEKTNEDTKKENVEVFSQSEKNDIQEILNYLE